MSVATKGWMEKILSERYPSMAAKLEEDKARAHTEDKFKRPWSVTVGGGDYPLSVRVVDRDGRPVVSFGNQRRHRGAQWTHEIADLIVDAVNSRNDVTYLDPAHQHHFQKSVECGIACECGGTLVFGGTGLSNSPMGHDAIYGLFYCDSCKRKIGHVSGFRYNPMGETGGIHHWWNGERFLRIHAEAEDVE
ncbi:MAG TPA: hypothetical protein VMW58_01405 [Anaerolineae bacterium]|nr:hypothetical protein [Anaerolineae bacterium]